MALVSLPLKQGLKQSDLLGLFESWFGFSLTSIKTRIETHLNLDTEKR